MLLFRKNSLFDELDAAFNAFDSYYTTTQTYRTKNGLVTYRDGVVIRTEDSSGTVKHFDGGILSRKDGPAVQYKDGRNEYWIDGKKTTKEEIDNLLKKEEESRKESYKVELTKSEKEKIEAALGRKL